MSILDKVMRIAGRDENGQARAIKTDNKGNVWGRPFYSSNQVNKTVIAVGNEEKRELVNATDLLIINNNPYVGVKIKINGGIAIELDPGKSVRIESETITTVDYTSNLAPAKLTLIGGY